MKIIPHLSAMAIITIIMGLIYVSVQQFYRSNANDPQVRIAYELRDHLRNGKPLSFTDTIELERSLSIFAEAYDENGDPMRSTGFLNGRMPQLPKDVFQYAKTNGEHWITWQPKQNIRMAIGIVRVQAGPIAYLAVGRSLKEVEARLSRLTNMLFVGWTLCIAIVLVNWLVIYYNCRKENWIDA